MGNLDTYNYIWPEDNISNNEIEEYDTKAEEVANSDDTYNQVHVAGDLDESQEEKDLIVENLMNADLPDWMKEQILGKKLMMMTKMRTRTLSGTRRATTPTMKYRRKRKE